MQCISLSRSICFVQRPPTGLHANPCVCLHPPHPPSRDAMYQSPLAEENSSRYVTLEKDLGGFNNIRLSLECGVAFAAATGRTFVIPPPFKIWNMHGKRDKQVRQVREVRVGREGKEES